MKRPQKSSGKARFDFTGWLGIILIVGMLYWLIATLLYGQHYQETMKRGDNAITTAVVSSEKVYLGNSPVSRAFYYKYEFAVGGRKYLGDSRDERKRPGDTIRIKFNKLDPDINQPVKQ